jgi:hypothetical protein
MAILAIKKLIRDLQENTRTVMTDPVASASTAAYGSSGTGGNL